MAAFDEEAVDPDTLIMLLQQQGRAALDEALQQLGVKPLGHRLKLANALLQVQVQQQKAAPR